MSRTRAQMPENHFKSNNCLSGSIFLPIHVVCILYILYVYFEKKDYRSSLSAHSLHYTNSIINAICCSYHIRGVFTLGERVLNFIGTENKQEINKTNWKGKLENRRRVIHQLFICDFIIQTR